MTDSVNQPLNRSDQKHGHRSCARFRLLVGSLLLVFTIVNLANTAVAMGQVAIPVDGREVSGSELISPLVLQTSANLSTPANTESPEKQIRLHNRMMFTGTLIATLLALLSVLFAFLKINHATRGFYGGRLQTLATVAAGICLVLGYAFYANWSLN